MKLPSLSRLRDLGRRGKEHNQLMLNLSQSRVNGHGDGVKVVYTGKGEVVNVKIDDSLKGNSFLIESGFVKACDDALTKMHELKKFHWEKYLEPNKETTYDRNFKRYDQDSPNRIIEASESFSGGPDNDPLPPYPYDTSLDQIQAIEQFCNEKNIDYEELIENYNEVSSFLKSKGVDPGEFEDRVLVKLQDYQLKLPPSMRKGLEDHIKKFLEVEGKYDILNKEEVDMFHLDRLEKEREETLWNFENQDLDIGARRELFFDIKENLLDPDFHGVFSQDDLEGLKRLLIDTTSDPKAMFENSPFLKDITKNVNIHHALSNPHTPSVDRMPGANTPKEVLSEFRGIMKRITQPPENPIETIEEFKKLDIDTVEYTRAISSGNIYNVADFLGREEVRQYNHFLEKKFGFTGTVTPEFLAKVREADPELADQMEKSHEDNKAMEDIAGKWHQENPNRSLLYGATASEIAQLAGLNDEQKEQFKEELKKIRTPL
eukprot:gb/GECH01013749.1/.p1 GENE.gb/GECH01013749.1/~~gb/GECH01013749.1/.p1  ORF type:complete len:489 (+),score=134.19 gb/GECH01013749.1/:1-1467(+)